MDSRMTQGLEAIHCTSRLVGRSLDVEDILLSTCASVAFMKTMTK